MSLKENLQILIPLLKDAAILLALSLVIVGVNKAGYWVHPFAFLLALGILIIIPSAIFLIIVYKVIKLL
jgi:hypothetical protein